MPSPVHGYVGDEITSETGTMVSGAVRSGFIGWHCSRTGHCIDAAQLVFGMRKRSWSQSGPGTTGEEKSCHESTEGVDQTWALQKLIKMVRIC